MNKLFSFLLTFYLISIYSYGILLKQFTVENSGLPKYSVLQNGCTTIVMEEL